MRKYLWAVLCLPFLLCVCGCWNLVEINDTAVCTGIGVDLEKNGEILCSLQLAKPTSLQSAGANENQTVILSSRGRTISEAVRRSSLTLPRVPLYAHARSYVIGEDLARTDLSYIIDSAARSYRIRKSSILLVAKGCNASKIIQTPMCMYPYSAYGLINILRLQKDQLSIYDTVRIDEFMRLLSSPGIEPVIPMVRPAKIANQDTLILDGGAVFKGRKMVGSLNKDEMKGYYWLSHSFTKGGILRVGVPGSPREKVILEVVHAQQKTQITDGKQGKPQVEINVNADLNFYEQLSSKDLLNPSMVLRLQKEADAEIEKQIIACIRKAQFLGSDITGWGQRLYASNPQAWAKSGSNWDEIYPNIEYSIKVESRVLSSTLTDKSFSFK